MYTYALFFRVKSIVEERQWSLNEGNARVLRDIDDLKVSSIIVYSDGVALLIFYTTVPRNAVATREKGD